MLDNLRGLLLISFFQETGKMNKMQSQIFLNSLSYLKIFGGSQIVYFTCSLWVFRVSHILHNVFSYYPDSISKKLIVYEKL